MDLLARSALLLLQGIAVTLLLGVVSFVLGSALGALIALARISRFRPRDGARGHAARRADLRTLTWVRLRPWR